MIILIVSCNHKGQSWEVEVRIIKVNGSFYDLMVSGRGSSFHLVVGEHAYGSFLCIPNLGIGCELAALTDKFWNLESVSRSLPFVDAATIVAAISHLHLV